MKQSNKKTEDMVIGDVHGHFWALNTLINKKKPKRIHICGDFGWWPLWNGRQYFRSTSPKKPRIWKQDSLKTNDTKLYFCPGNHEDWWDLMNRNDSEELLTNLFYKPRGSTLTLPDGRNIMYFGGAESIDKEFRTIGFDWFPEEAISYSDLENLPDVNIDIVISHTLPRCFGDLKEERSFKKGDPSRLALNVVYDKYKPKYWYGGHFHRFMSGKYENTDWYSLAEDGHLGWWMWM